MSTETPLIQKDIIDGISRIKLNRLDKKNAINTEMYIGLRESLLDADANDDVRAIFIFGDESCFSAGNDLKDFIGIAQGDSPNAIAEFVRAISQTQKPIVAAVGGPAVGVGMTILLHCDLVYAGEKAQFRLPFVEMGLCPEAGSSYLLPKLAGYQVAAEILMLGEFFDAEKAREIGLVNAIYPEESLITEAWRKAEKLASMPPGALQVTKRLMKRGSAAVLKETIEEEFVNFLRQLKSSEALQAFQKFFAK